MDTAQTDWSALKARLHSRWPALSEDELDATQGDPEILLALLEAKYGYARANAEGDLRLVMNSAAVSGPFIAGNSNDPDDVANSGTIDRPLERSIDLSSGVTSHYLEWPHDGARPMLLLHGLGGCATDWQRLAAHFQPQFRVLALDQRGHGDSHASDGRYSVAAHIADINAFVEILDLDGMILLGHAMGGYHALAHASANPDRVSAVIVSSLSTSTLDPVQGIAGQIFDTAQQYFDVLRAGSPAAPDWALWSLAGGRLHEVDGGYQVRIDPDAAVAWQPPDVGRIDAPVLAIDDRTAVGDEDVAWWQADTELVSLVNPGMNPFIENEEEFLDAIDRFLVAHSLTPDMASTT